MKALLLAAGVGRRLGDGYGNLPKALLPFGGKSLLERHLDILSACGIAETTIVAGHDAESIRAEVARLGAGDGVRLVVNQRYREGSVVSLWQARETLLAGDTLLLMDADVLYDARLMERLLSAPPENCFLLDRNIDPGEEPVKLCIAGGRIVDFRKRPAIPHDWHGESVGFFRFSAAVAQELAALTDSYVMGGRAALEYEEPIRDLVLEAPAGKFGFADVTGLPWIEIDFPEDVARAMSDILPLLRDRQSGAP